MYRNMQKTLVILKYSTIIIISLKYVLQFEIYISFYGDDNITSYYDEC